MIESENSNNKKKKKNKKNDFEKKLNEKIINNDFLSTDSQLEINISNIENIVDSNLVKSSIETENLIPDSLIYSGKENNKVDLNKETNQNLDVKLKETSDLPAHDISGEVLLDESIVAAEFKKAEETQKPKSKKKNIIFSLVFLGINIILVSIIATSLIKSADASLIDVFSAQGKRLWWLALAFGFLAIMLLSDAAAFFILIKKTTGKFRPWLAYKTTSMGKYYESVTPLALGMQPGQIVELSRGGISAGVATSIPIMKMIIYNLMNVILALIFLIGVGMKIPSGAEKDLAYILLVIFKVFAYIGVIFSGSFIFIIMLIANSKIAGRSLARFVVRTGYKLRLVKNYRNAYNKLMNSVLEFQNSMSYFKKNKGTLLAVVGFTVLSLLAMASLPYAIIMALSNVTFSSFGEGLWFWLECVARFYICFLAASYIPLPGGTGMMEISFFVVFGGSNFLWTNIVWGFLSWRIISYYLIIGQGIIMVIIDTTRTIISARKNKRNKEKAKL